MTNSHPPYAELQTTSNFSFLRGASHPAELVEAAAQKGLAAIAIADRNSFAGLVRAHLAAKAHNIKLVIACHIDFVDGPSLLAYPTDRKAYGRLCALLSRGKLRTKKGQCELFTRDLFEHAKGSFFSLIPPRHITPAIEQDYRNIVNRLPLKTWLTASLPYRGNDREHLARLDHFAKTIGAHLLASNDVHYHIPERRPLQDVVSCIREGKVINRAGFLLAANSERHIKSPEQMALLFNGFEHAMAATIEIANACNFSLSELRYEYPIEPIPKGKTAQQHLVDLTWTGANWRYDNNIPEKVRANLDRELSLIDELNYAPYFLTVHDIVDYARTPQPQLGRHDPILCQGRGSAANSSVCYCLGITSVDPNEIDLLFERFVTKERDEPPDIDVDFEHERREEVIQYIYQRYGRDRAGIAATIVTYRPRSAIGEVGKVMGLTPDITSLLAKTVWGSHGRDVSDKQIAESGLDLDDPHLQMIIDLARQLLGFPRHLSQHVGGFVLTRHLLTETVPVGNAAMDGRTFIEWDKNDIDALGILKVDVLGLGMLTCIRRAFDLLHHHYGIRHTLASLPQGDKAVYDMICKADTLGVFQIESRAQMSMLPRLRPRCFYDLVIEVAIVRPGPIQGDMVHPYLRRRKKLEEVIFPSPHPDHGPADELEQILGKTLGVPLFQEQAMRIAMQAAKFSPAELNQLRHAMATFRRNGTIHTLEEKMISRMITRGYTRNFAERCFEQIKGFSDYGFPESHAASFALLVYISCWLKHHYPDIFAAALLNSQPMGFYAPAQIINDARKHGVPVHPADINHSNWDCTLEKLSDGSHAIRIGLRQIRGLSKQHIEDLMAARTHPFTSLSNLQNRTGLRLFDIEKLATADAFHSIGLNRRQAQWEARALSKQSPTPLFAHTNTPQQGFEEQIQLPLMPLSENVVADYQTLRFSLKGHPLSFLRKQFTDLNIITTNQLARLPNRKWAKIAGLVLVRQRPDTAKGVVFMTIEDETGVANIIVWKTTREKFNKVVMGAKLVEIYGQVQCEDGVMHLIARKMVDHTPMLTLLAGEQPTMPASRDFH
jgi:error-prone DNA polymerase